MHAVFLYHAIQQGMDFGIVNPATKVLYSDIPQDQLTVIEDVILNRRKGAAETLTELANRLLEEQETKKDGIPGSSSQGDAKNHSQEEWRSADVDHRLQHALIKGVGDYLQQDMQEEK